MSLDQDTVKRIVEGALFAAGQPMKLEKLAGLFLEEEAPPTEMLVEAINQLKAEYEGRGVMLKEVASGFRFQVEETVGEWVSRLWEEKPARYSRALLETLALIAYRQPITRGEIEEIRGVSVSSHITKTLLEREWIRVVGHRDVPGRPAMYGTTRNFLDYFNLKNLDELPSLAEIRDLDAINAELELVQQGLDPNGQLDVDEGPEDGVDDATTPSQALDSLEEAEAEPAVASADEMIREAPTDAEESVIVKPDENT
ncbi:MULTISPECIES: SMC-Scp complex subunit ScpB [unclassified Ketobacter]|uniref:SMC-Scp complex subunit ScpB n=1 Tax=unclassified Ketobacter TaxID=2639109 RepID=UPI000F172A85|nr:MULTISPECIES: SMC-Scp complex subunit ScpB [unclassified Ketobacter]RLT88671.1 MAG: SMC-Scp complex subunit ScpB [Ketobacter sp. GenoA1]RLT97728.1 MAG: SMC-Scp complex subunit ScpB [Ketobacter sp.]